MDRDKDGYIWQNDFRFMLTEYGAVDLDEDEVECIVTQVVNCSDEGAMGILDLVEAGAMELLDFDKIKLPEDDNFSCWVVKPAHGNTKAHSVLERHPSLNLSSEFL